MDDCIEQCWAWMETVFFQVENLQPLHHDLDPEAVTPESIKHVSLPGGGTGGACVATEF
jgi:hypothetical protein